MTSTSSGPAATGSGARANAPKSQRAAATATATAPTAAATPFQPARAPARGAGPGGGSGAGAYAGSGTGECGGAEQEQPRSQAQGRPPHSGSGRNHAAARGLAERCAQDGSAGSAVDCRIAPSPGSRRPSASSVARVSISPAPGTSTARSAATPATSASHCSTLRRGPFCKKGSTSSARPCSGCSASSRPASSQAVTSRSASPAATLRTEAENSIADGSIAGDASRAANRLSTRPVGARRTIHGVIDHVGVNVKDYAVSRRFYEQALEPLGYRVRDGVRRRRRPPGSARSRSRCSGSSEREPLGTGTHVAFTCPDRATSSASTSGARGGRHRQRPARPARALPLDLLRRLRARPRRQQRRGRLPQAVSKATGGEAGPLYWADGPASTVMHRRSGLSANQNEV